MRGGCTPETPRKGLRQAERGVAEQAALTTAELERVKDLARPWEQTTRAAPDPFSPGLLALLPAAVTIDPIFYTLGPVPWKNIVTGVAQTQPSATYPGLDVRARLFRSSPARQAL